VPWPFQIGASETTGPACEWTVITVDVSGSRACGGWN